tara:strand:+ start:1336 stop:1806 length:471 start_codon:yes stop_codon:yes gene_type:complete
MEKEEQHIPNNIKNKRIKIIRKKNIKESIEAKLSKMYPSQELYTKELSYDLDIENEFQKMLSIDKQEVDLNIIQQLPVLELTTIVDEDGEEITNETECDNIPDEYNDNEDEIDKDSLEKECIGEIYYYFDYTKGIIYDLQYKIIGSIDEYGELNIT